MKNIFFVLLAFAATLSFSSCEKDDIGCANAEVRFSCTSDNPYNIYINNQFETVVQGKNFVDIELEEGFYKFKVEQVSGFVLFPTVQEIEKTLDCGEEFQFIFP